DTRVYYVEPAKWVAALRHANNGVNSPGGPVLLKTQMNAGHGGISGRYERWKETAFQYSWLLATADADNDRGGQDGNLVDSVRE
ncbi:MAG: oligopeptidase, partial [Mycobacterium sp.]|nr:oligopeptidase [Mycobacterium sp.]